jgi:hypothetical protein
MTLHPRVPTDLALAPVAAEIDINLQRIRDKSPAEIDFEVQLEFNGPVSPNTRANRAAAILMSALRDVDMHNWSADITDDGCGLRLTGGSVSLDLGLSANILRFIEAGVDGVDPAPAAAKTEATGVRS